MFSTDAQNCGDSQPLPGVGGLFSHDAQSLSDGQLPIGVVESYSTEPSNVFATAIVAPAARSTLSLPSSAPIRCSARHEGGGAPDTTRTPPAAPKRVSEAIFRAVSLAALTPPDTPIALPTAKP